MLTGDMALIALVELERTTKFNVVDIKVDTLLICRFKLFIFSYLLS